MPATRQPKVESIILANTTWRRPHLRFKKNGQLRPGLTNLAQILSGRRQLYTQINVYDIQNRS